MFMSKKITIAATGKRRDALAIIAFLLLVLVVWVWISLASGVKTAYVEKTDGVFDLRNFDFETTVQKVDDLTTWESWPWHLYTPVDFDAGIPGDGIVMGRDDFIEVQYVTHRLTLLLPPGEIYGISMKTPVYSMRLFIGGEEIAVMGNPATTREEVVPATRERTYFFQPQSERVDIIIQTSNFVHGKSGCRPPVITVGYGENINTMDRRASFLNALVIGCLLTTCLYHLSLFLLNRRRGTALLFSLCCLLLTLLDKRLTFALFPDMSWYAEVRLEYLVHFLTFAGLVWFVYRQFRGLLHKQVVYPYCVLALLYCLTVALDTRFFTGILAYFDYISIAMIVYVAVRFALSLRAGRLQNLLGFVGILVLGLCGINDILDNRNLVLLFGFEGQLYTTPLGMVFFVFCYSLMISIENAEIQRREEALAERNAMLDGLNRTKTEFLQDMSHEMKAPLTVIAAGIDAADMYIRKGEAGREKAESALDTVREETQRLGRMVKGMLDLATMSGIAENRKRVDFAALLERSAEASRLMLEKRNNALRVEIAPGLPDVFVEHDRFAQVMTNLLSNAADHTRDGQVSVTAERSDGLITVQVSDTGSGIESDLLPTVLERGVSGRGGTGYGLYICKTVVEAHGGTIQVESELGEGTAVTFTVPVYGGQEAIHGS